MFIAKEGTVYSVLPYVSPHNYSFVEATCEEGAIGFLFLKKKYHAVTFRCGKWNPSDPMEFMEYYQAQQNEWMDVGVPMPWSRRFAFLRLFVEICGTGRGPFNHFY